MPKRRKFSLTSFFKKYDVWVFPAIVGFALLTLTVLNIHGSSIGAYYQLQYGLEAQDPQLLLFKPRAIRSDEWLVNTQLTIAQEQQDYQVVNENIGDGIDLSVISDAPNTDWSTIFKPQNWAFFLLPFGMAFAFKWWLLGASLVLACYALMLRLFKKKIALAILVSLAVLFNPFVFWWYQSITLLPLTYGFLALALAVALYESNRHRQKLLLAALLTFVMISFALVLYPPFQVPVVLVCIAFAVGYLLSKRTDADFSQRFRSLWPYAGIALMTSVIVGSLFIITKADVIRAISDTVYPGVRDVQSGGFEAVRMFSNFLQYDLQLERAVPGFLFTNQSESSSWLLPFILIVPVAIGLVALELKKLRRVNWVLVALVAISLVFLAFMFIPWPNLPYKLLLLNKVQKERLLIGVGFVSALMLPYMFQSIDVLSKGRKADWIARFIKTKLHLIVFCLTLALTGVSGYYIWKHYPAFISSPLHIAVLGVLYSIVVGTLLSRYYMTGLVCLVILGVFSVATVHPVYHGLAVIEDSPIIASIEEESAKAGGSTDWGVVDSILLENFPLLAGQNSYSGVFIYPNFETWHKFDPEQNEEDLYNRYAHALFVEYPTPKANEDILLIQPDAFQIILKPCEGYQKEIEFFLSPRELKFDCLVEKRSIPSGIGPIYIYGRP